MSASGSILRARFSGSVVWNLISAVSNQGATLVMGVAIARILDPENFGAFSIVWTTILTVGAAGQLALGFTATRFVSQFRESEPARAASVAQMLARLALAAGAAGGVLLFLLAPRISASALFAPEVTLALQVGSIAAFAMIVAGYQLGVIAGIGDFKRIAHLSLWFAVLTCCGSAAGAVLAGPTGAVVGLTIVSIARLLMQGVDVRKKISALGSSTRASDVQGERRLLLRYAAPAALAGLSTMPALWVANAALARSPEGLEAVAALSVALAIRSLVLFLPNVTDSVTTSFLGARLGARDLAGFRQLLLQNVAICTVVAASVAIVLWLVSDWLLAIYGTEYLSASRLLPWLLFSAVTQAGSAAIYQVVSMSGKMWASLFAIALPRDLLFALLSLILAAQHGALGIAWAYAASWAFGLVATSLVAAILVQKGLQNFVERAAE
jgi:O-antigen/teichoic acid export membrane protein